MMIPFMELSNHKRKRSLGHNEFEGLEAYVGGNTKLALGTADLVLMRWDEVSTREILEAS